jgi:cell fate regulator YaaT (PSP1 superfamily)
MEGHEGLEQGEILRNMSANDMNELQHMRSQSGDEFRKCQEHVARLGLNMELVDLEHVFGGERIIVYYLAEKRVDFRELVRMLAREFQTRIEMRQIGVRDEAKLLADYGDCGKPVCCNTHLTTMPPVSMKMAKIQKATLDPTKISGRCGRLKCCLRYEYDTYVEMQRELPPVGSEIVTGNGKATVLGHEILAQQLLVEMEDNRRTIIELAEVISIIRSGRPKKNNDRKSESKKSGTAKSGKVTEQKSQDSKTSQKKSESEAGKSGEDAAQDQKNNEPGKDD